MSAVVPPSLSIPGVKLGKKRAKFDRRTVQMAPKIQKRKLPKITLTRNLSTKTISAFPDGLGMMLNDHKSDCTCAGAGHSIQTYSTYGGAPWRPTDEQILAAYDLVNDGVDEGAAMLDVLKMWRNVGIGGNKIYGFVAVDPLDHDQVRTAHTLFGGLYFGANLPANLRDQIAANDRTKWTLSKGNGSEPGGLGGHCMNVPDYTPAGPVAVTWGELQPIAWDWWDRYVDECYGILDASYVGADDKSPEGFSMEALAADLAAL